ncbi:MAG: nitrous oxide reductase accessory protein NosL [Campylobacteraceae bacterium]|nr:nitrous oxide reductase accessory protein NosL [Campylobacteraceae bacterium]
MKKFKLLSLLLISLIVLFSGCEKKEIGGVEKIHWDRDMCERCKMAISERKYAFEIVNPKSGKTYKFDDIGCAVLWMDEEKITWKDQAILWITDAKNGKWIDAREAYYTSDSITTMAYGIAAYSKKDIPKGKKTISFEDAKKVVYQVEKLNTQKLEEIKKEEKK